MEKIKAPLKGVITEKYPLKFLKHVAMVMSYTLETVKSIVQNCPGLQYLEIKELLLHSKFLDDDDISSIFIKEAENLQVLRILFNNNISMLYGMTEILKKCPAIRMVGDFKYWAVTGKSFYRLHKQINLHNFRIVVEYDGILHNSSNALMESTV